MPFNIGPMELLVVLVVIVGLVLAIRTILR